MSKITPLMTSLHEGHKADERIKCIDNILFSGKCCDTKDTIWRAFWWYRKHSIPLDKVIQAKEDIQKLRGCSCSCSDGIIDDVEEILDKLIEGEE